MNQHTYHNMQLLTNQARLHAWRERLKRHDDARKQGHQVNFLLPIIKL